MLAEADTMLAGEYRFQSVEVKDHAFRFDGILALPDFVGQFFFAEVQYQKDKRFYTRLFAQIMIFLHQKQPQGTWRVIVIFPKRSIDPKLPEHLTEYVMSGRLKIVYLNELPPASLRQFPLTLLRLVSAPNRQSDISGTCGRSIAIHSRNDRNESP